MSVEITVDSALVRLQKLVYKNRIRVKEFITDFDKLRSGYVHINHFMAALSMAGVDKYLTAAEMQILTDAYTVPRTASLSMVDYRAFLYDVDIVFTISQLEKTPLTDVPKEPSYLLDKTRYMKSSRDLGPEKEERVDSIVRDIADKVYKRGTPVKPFFDDSAEDDHSAKLFGHVTYTQFKQCINVKLGLEIAEKDMDLLIEKYKNEDKPEMVNYMAFANTVDPAGEAINPYQTGR